jgi:hypothetical protein
MDEDLPDGSGSEPSHDDRHQVLEVFGLKLEVSNPRLAELLTMDAKDALTTDLKELNPAGDARELREVTAQALPDVMVSAPTARENLEEAERKEFRGRVAAIGRTLGFDSSPDGLWSSPMGVSILTRCIERPMSLAGATHYVGELADHREQAAGVDATVLFVLDGTQSVDVFRVAIRQRRLYDVMRVISLQNLEAINHMAQVGTVDHAKAVILLTPAANIDVGEMLSVIAAASRGNEDA